MKKARNRKEVDVREAENLFTALGQKNLIDYCLPVSLRALGGAVHVYQVLKQKDSMARLSTVNDYGLKTGFFLDIYSPIDQDHLDAILHELSTTTIDETYTDFSGVLIHISFPGVDHPNNHYIALIPRFLLSKKFAKRLERDNSHVVIDTSSKPIKGVVRISDLQTYINQMIEAGAGVGFMQIFKDTN